MKCCTLEKSYGGKKMKFQNVIKKVIVPITLIVLILAGCSGGDNDSEATNDSSSEEIVVWSWTPNDEIIEDFAEQFKEDHPDFELTLENMGSGDSYNDKLQTTLQSGGKSLPDILLLEDNVTQRFLDQYDTYFADLNELGFDEISENYADYKVDVSTKDDSVYGFPYDAGPTAVFYRKDIFENSGIDADDIETWDDYIEAGKTIYSEQDIKLLSMDQGDDSLVRMMTNQQGVSYFDDNGEPVLDAPEMEKSLEILEEMNEEDLISLTTGWDPWVADIMSGDVASIPMASWFALNFETVAEDQSGQWGAINLPAVEAGGNRTANFGGSQYLITESSDQKELAFEFLEGLTLSEDIQETLVDQAIFPAANTNYESDIFTQDVDYFEEPIWELFTEQMSDIQPINYTANFTIAKNEIANIQQRIFEGASVEESMDQGQKKVENDVQ